MGSGTHPEIIVCSSPCHPQMQVKALSLKKQAVPEHDPETLLSFLGQSSFKMDAVKLENSSWRS